MPTFRLGVDDLPVIVVLGALVSIERLKNELEVGLVVDEEENTFEEYGSELLLLANKLPLPE